MGFFTSPDGQGYSGSDEEADGNLIQEFQPGMFQQLPQGMQFESFDPKHPNTAYADFVKQILRSVSSGTLVSYNSLASDLESVNYSSIRAGAKEEQSQWQSIQEMVISRFMNPVYEEWLKMGITAGALNLPIAKMEKFKSVKWHPRGWSYVDPEKELKAKKLALEMGATSLAEITGEMGKEWTDILAQLKSEKDLVKNLDLGLIQPLATEKEPIPETENETEI
jgi:lambda family phage portal protein